MKMSTIFMFILLATIIADHSIESISEDCFRAAVYQHIRIGNLSDDPSVIAQKNLDVYEDIVLKASKEGAQILVFPEDGIIYPKYSRSVVTNIAELIPDPKTGHHNPCENPIQYRNLTKTYRLSCLAKHNKLYIVTDYSDRVVCDNQTDPKCPTDGQYLFNTAVAFAPDGSIAAKYHKMQLFSELYYNVPPKPEFIYFETPFGRLGLLICFDILYHNPGIELINKYGVQTILMPTWWFDELPFRSAQQIQVGYAVTNRVNLLAANLLNLGIGSTGSGIYSGTNGQMIDSDVNEQRPLLLIADIPIDSRNSGAKCLTNRYNKTVENRNLIDHGQYFAEAKLNLNESTRLRLTQSEANVTICHKDLCCHLNYTLSSDNYFKDESFWFFVSNRSDVKLQLKHYPQSTQFCGIFRCDDEECHSFSTQTKQIVFKTLEITTRMDTNFTYPSATTNHLKLLPKRYWIYENNGTVGSEVKFRLNNSNETVLSVALYGRCYDKDPLYRQ